MKNGRLGKLETWAEEYWIFLEIERDREPDGEQTNTAFTSSLTYSYFSGGKY